MPKDYKVIGELREAGELRTMRKDIFVKWLPGTRVDHQEASPCNFQRQRDGCCGEDIQQCRGKLRLTFFQISSIATTKQNHLMVALNALGVDVL
jgi:hypothetical protein